MIDSYKSNSHGNSYMQIHLFQYIYIHLWICARVYSYIYEYIPHENTISNEKAINFKYFSLGNAIFDFFKNLVYELSFHLNFPRRSAREYNFPQNFLDALYENAIFFKLT